MIYAGIINWLNPSIYILLEMYFDWKLEGLDERVNLVGAEIFISFIVAPNSG